MLGVIIGFCLNSCLVRLWAGRGSGINTYIFLANGLICKAEPSVGHRAPSLLRGIDLVHLSSQPCGAERFTSWRLGQKPYLPVGVGKACFWLIPAFIPASFFSPHGRGWEGEHGPHLAGTGHPFSPDHIEFYCLSGQVLGIAAAGGGVMSVWRPPPAAFVTVKQFGRGQGLSCGWEIDQSCLWGCQTGLALSKRAVREPWVPEGVRELDLHQHSQ